MRDILAAAASLLIVTSAATSAHAEPVTIVIDDFSTAQTVKDTKVGGAQSSTVSYSIGGNAFTRTLIVDQKENRFGGTSLAQIGDPDPTDDLDVSVFSLSNSSGVNSQIELVYNIDALLNDFSGGSKLSLSVLFADAASGQPFTIEGFLNGAALGSQTFTGPGHLDFALAALNESGGNELRLVFTGGTSFDATLDDIIILAQGSGGGLPVPEPGAIGLLGLGLAGVALRRRKTA